VPEAPESLPSCTIHPETENLTAYSNAIAVTKPSRMPIRMYSASLLFPTGSIITRKTVLSRSIVHHTSRKWALTGGIRNISFGPYRCTVSTVQEREVSGPLGLCNQEPGYADQNAAAVRKLVRVPGPMPDTMATGPASLLPHPFPPYIP
jgi:hypothetical protein